MKKIALACAFALAMVSPAIAADFRSGDWVLAQWQGAQYWFPGVVDDVRGNMITVRYDDGTTDQRPANQVRRYDWRVGSRVECRWQSGDDWYPGRITGESKDGQTISVRYDDGDQEHTSTGKCRSR
jgi:hypothetical protein